MLQPARLFAVLIVMKNRKIALTFTTALIGIGIVGCSPKETPIPVRNSDTSNTGVLPTATPKPIDIEEENGTFGKVVGENTTKEEPVKPDEITFQERCPMGYKFISESHFTRNDATGTPAALTINSVSELVQVDNGRFTWKSTYDMKLDEMGAHHFVFGKGLETNRVVFDINDAYGNLINAEGYSPDTDLSYEIWPEHPVKAGDTWEGYTIHKGEKFTDRYKLEYVATVNHTDYAVVSRISTVNGSQKTMKWVDLATGVVVKSESSGDTLDQEGQPFNFNSSTAVVDEQGHPLLP